MEKTIKEFEIKKQKSMKLLKEVRDFLLKGKKLNIEIEDKMIKKVEKSLEKVEDEKLKVALIGGFSEGKTSIAAAWLEKYDKSSMKISQQESSNEVIVYDINDKIVLIDTPGLFGFKETEDKKEKYKEITKKYEEQTQAVQKLIDSLNENKNKLDKLQKDLLSLNTMITIEETQSVSQPQNEVQSDKNEQKTNLNNTIMENIKNQQPQNNTDNKIKIN